MIRAVDNAILERELQQLLEGLVWPDRVGELTLRFVDAIRTEAHVGHEPDPMLVGQAHRFLSGIRPGITPPILAGERYRPDEQRVLARDGGHEDDRASLSNEGGPHRGYYKVAFALFLVVERGSVENILRVDPEELVPAGLPHGNMGENFDCTGRTRRCVKA